LRVTRRGYDWTDRYPAIARAAAQLKARSFSIDGEAVTGRAHKVSRLSALVSERQSGAKYLYRVKHEFSVKAAFYVGSPPEAMLLACKKEVADSVAIAP
jgi:ATP-dependent DNA ligase